MMDRRVEIRYRVKQISEIIHLLVGPSYAEVCRSSLYEFLPERPHFLVCFCKKFIRLLKIDEFGHFILPSSVNPLTCCRMRAIDRLSDYLGSTLSRGATRSRLVTDVQAAQHENRGQQLWLSCRCTSTQRKLNGGRR